MILGSIILTGGNSNRMGQPKEALRFGDTTFLGNLVDTLLTCTWPVLVVARDEDQELPPLALESETIYDKEPGSGPLGGFKTALEQLRMDGSCEAVYLTGCDVAFPDPAAIEWLTQQLGPNEAVVTRIDDIIQPLCGIYRVDVLDKIADASGSLQSLVEKIDARILAESEVDSFDKKRRFLRSVNTKEEYEALRAEFDEG